MFEMDFNKSQVKTMLIPKTGWKGFHILKFFRKYDQTICKSLPRPIVWRKQAGLTLVEVMISLLVGAFLIGGVTQVFINTRQTYQAQEALSRLQENGRFAMLFIGNDIRMADYRVCPSTPSSATAITGVNGNTAPTPDVSDSFTAVWDTAVCTVPVTSVLRTAAYSVNASFILLKGVGGASQLVEGVENMQVTYGMDTDADGIPNYYTSANVALNWTQVVSVRVSLVMRSLDDNLTTKPLPYTFNGQTIPVADRRFRRVFTSTFALRNRIH